MCRSIKTLANFEPPATPEEVRAASLQFVRKLSGSNRPSRANQAAFDRAAVIDDITSIRGKDLKITKRGDKVVVGYDYQREIHVAGPAYLTLKYSGETK